jgi:hypothetical protein
VKSGTLPRHLVFGREPDVLSPAQVRCLRFAGLRKRLGRRRRCHVRRRWVHLIGDPLRLLVRLAGEHALHQLGFASCVARGRGLGEVLFRSVAFRRRRCSDPSSTRLRRRLTPLRQGLRHGLRCLFRSCRRRRGLLPIWEVFESAPIKRRSRACRGCR